MALGTLVAFLTLAVGGQLPISGKEFLRISMTGRQRR